MSEDRVGQLVELLHVLGVPEDEIERAANDGVHVLAALYVERSVVPGHERLTRIQVEERAGVPDEEARAFWRALGFADVPDDEPAFTEVDIEMLQRAVALINSGLVEREMALQHTRVMGRATSQIASALLDAIRRGVGDDAEGPPPHVLAALPTLLDNLETWLVYIWRRHFAEEAKRVALMAGHTEAGTAIVGFADLVGFTGISQHMDEETLAKAVSSFESTAVDIITSHGGRTIKMIGDEAMFEAPSPREGASIAIDILKAIEANEALPDVRIGLAFGPATRNQGDIYGTAPNLASRLVEEAYPGTILVSESVHDSLASDDGLDLKPVRPRHLKGFGRTKLWVLRDKTMDSPTRATWRLAPIADEILGSLSAALDMEQRSDER